MTAEIGPSKLESQFTAEIAVCMLQTRDFLEFLKKHAYVFQKILKPRGFGYATFDAQKQQISYALSSNIQDLQSTETGLIQDVFLQKIIQVYKNPQSLLSTPEETQSLYTHYWTPCIFNKKITYVIHAWFEASSYPLPERQSLMEAAAKSLELFLKTQSSEALSQAITQASANTQLCEELAGCYSLEKIGWNIVNYAREALQCSRVCLFSVKKSTAPKSWTQSTPISQRHYTIEACSGLKKVHKRSEHATILLNTATTLIEKSFENLKKQAQDRSEPMSSAPLAIGLCQRNAPLKERPSAIIEYFKRIPMNWAVSVPLYDAEGIVSGLLLFEGQDAAFNLDLKLPYMQQLAQASGKTLATALSWNAEPSQKYIEKWAQFLTKTTPSWRRVMRKKWALGMLIVLGVLLFPLPENITGVATIRPLEEANIPAYRLARLESRSPEIGKFVNKGEILATLATEDIRHGLAESLKNLMEAQAEIGRAQLQRDEKAEAYARIATRTAEAAIHSMELALERSYAQAPFDGILVGPPAEQLRPGSIVLPGQILATVIDPTQWHVQIHLREQDLVAIEEKIKNQTPCKGSLALIALPTSRYAFTINDLAQLQYGKSPTEDRYTYCAVVTLCMSKNEGRLLRQGYVGEAKIDIGWQTLAHFLFHDFITFIRVRWF